MWWHFEVFVVKYSWLPCKSKNDCVCSQIVGHCGLLPSGVKGQLIKPSLGVWPQSLRRHRYMDWIISCVELSRSFKAEHPSFLPKTKTSFYKQSWIFDCRVVSLKSINLDDVVLRPSQNLTKAAATLLSTVMASACPHMTLWRFCSAKGGICWEGQTSGPADPLPPGSSSKLRVSGCYSRQHTETCFCGPPTCGGRRKNVEHPLMDNEELKWNI